jgi:hypothetical protein
MQMKKSMLWLLLSVWVVPAAFADPVTLVTTGNAGYYNNDIGTTLNLSNTGTNTCSEPFPTTNDCNTSYGSAPNLSAAGSILGNWLTDPLHLNSHWDFLAAIPNSWAVGTEVAVMYQFDTLQATNVVARFGVDNGIYVWLDGVYLFGARAAGGVNPTEYTVNIGNLNSGTHFLQLILEDHGSTNGYAVNITADTFIPGPPPHVPESGTLATILIGIGATTLLVSRRM